MEYREVELTVVPTIGFKVVRPVTKWPTVSEILSGLCCYEISIDVQSKLIMELRSGTMPDIRQK